jgi:hypothetical protein
MLDGFRKYGPLLISIQVAACAQQAEPLSITLRNPKNNTVITCTAHQSPIRPSDSLSSTVELCAKQLEARGFVRVD